MLLCLPVMMAAGLTSCDRVIYDYEGDCSVHYMVQFRYDYNMKYADAFAHEVEYVTLYLIDADGNVVLEQTEDGAALGAEGYEMEVGVDPGRYSLLAWCGTKDCGSFTVPQADVATGLTCSLGCLDDGDGLYVDSEVDRLYYGWLEDQEFDSTEGIHTFVMPLVKDTNSVIVVLQHTSGEEVDKDRFSFTITGDNWLMDWDNSLASDEEVTYYAWHTEQGSADFDLDGSSETESSPEVDGTRSGAETKATFSAAVAEFTIGRMVAGHDLRLAVTDRESGGTVLSIPLIDIALMVKGYDNGAMDDQEYLDRQDEYSLVFFLDDGGRWIDSYIYINSWRIVLQGSSL